MIEYAKVGKREGKKGDGGRERGKEEERKSREGGREGEGKKEGSGGSREGWRDSLFFTYILSRSVGWLRGRLGCYLRLVPSQSGRSHLDGEPSHAV